MSDLRARLINWGNHVGGRTGPETYPSVAPMFQDAPTSKWWEDAWGEHETVPQEINPPIDEKDAEIIDRLVLTIKSERLKLALLIEYADTPKTFNWRRYGYTESVNEACRLMDDLLHGQSKKAIALRMITENRYSGAHIAQTVGCSEAFICQLKAA